MFAVNNYPNATLSMVRKQNTLASDGIVKKAMKQARLLMLNNLHVRLLTN